MSDYQRVVLFAPKDALLHGDPNKVVRGFELDIEFDAIQDALNGKYDAANIATYQQAIDGTNNDTIMTPLRVRQVLDDGWVTIDTAQDITASKTFVNAFLAFEENGQGSGGATWAMGASYFGTSVFALNNTSTGDANFAFSATDGGSPVRLSGIGSTRELYWNNILIADTNGPVGGGIGEAPEDGTPYERQDATWVPAGGGGGNFVTVDTAQEVTGLKTFTPGIIIPAQGTSGVNFSIVGGTVGLPLLTISPGPVAADTNFTIATRNNGDGDYPALQGTGATRELYWDGVLIADTNGPIGGGIGEAPNDGQEYVRQSEAWTLNTGGSFPEAPTDGQQYGRQNSSWTVIAAGGGDPFDEAPNDGNSYARQSLAWNQIPNDPIGDAPSDGTPYERQDGIWVPAGGGGGNFVTVDTAQTITGTKTFQNAAGITLNTAVGDGWVLGTLNAGTAIIGIQPETAWAGQANFTIVAQDATGTHVGLNAFGATKELYWNDVLIADTNGPVSPFPEAPIDTNPYARQDAGWVQSITSTDFTTLETTVNNHIGDGTVHFADAPADGSQYARIDNTWQIVAGGGGGEANTSSNAGTGEGLALPKAGVDLPFKGIAAGTGITVSSTADTVTIGTTAAVGNFVTLDTTQTVAADKTWQGVHRFSNAANQLQVDFGIQTGDASNPASNQFFGINLFANNFDYTISATGKISKVDTTLWSAMLGDDVPNKTQVLAALATVPGLPTNIVYTDTTQTISGVKTFTAQNAFGTSGAPVTTQSFGTLVCANAGGYFLSGTGQVQKVDSTAYGALLGTDVPNKTQVDAAIAAAPVPSHTHTASQITDFDAAVRAVLATAISTGSINVTGTITTSGAIASGNNVTAYA